MKKLLLSALVILFSWGAKAENIEVNSFLYAGPYPIQKPLMLDSVDVNSKKFDDAKLLETTVSFNALEEGKTVSSQHLPGYTSTAIHLLGFTLQNTQYANGTLNVEGLKNYQLFQEGKEIHTGKITLEPGTHNYVIKYLTHNSQDESVKVSFETEKEGAVQIASSTERLYTLMDVLHAIRFSGVSLSPNGKYMIVGYNHVLTGGKSSRVTKIIEVATGKVMGERAENINWMPVSNQYYFTRHTNEGRQLISIDPATSVERILCPQVPEGYFTISPTEDFLIVTQRQEGPKEREGIYQILEPDDRQPGWRERSNLAKYDLNTGILQPLTYGYHNIYLEDISQDGQYMLFGKSESRLTQRPTTVMTLYLMNLKTLETEILIEKDGFINGAQFSPNGKQILISGSPEALNGIGKNVKPDQIPSMYDYQLYLMNLEDKKVKPLTKDFNPAVSKYVWSKVDNQIYFNAENRDYISLYRLNPKDGKISQLQTSEDLVSNFSLASTAPILTYYGQGASNSDRLYTLDTKSLKTTLKEDLSAKTLANIKLGECKEWNFVNSRGDTIYGRYYLPPSFDPNKKYPLIVNYYGGCSPTERAFETRYPHHAYAALGYVVYVVEPSGATGFGQEFSARHVNTAGEGPAQDIIEGTQTFCKEHPFVNDKKIGCIGASYGGFMTQYLQTKTHIFAAAISHAGISDHTSYWGEGYWGYSYSEVSMAESYPWTRKDLYVDRSPLFNADKINTPILFLHGDADTNVPVGESIQMFTALKLLGKETAFVAVKDQNHHILDYNKRQMWQNTIFAWFAKYLQDDSTWWDAIYTPKSL